MRVRKSDEAYARDKFSLTSWCSFCSIISIFFLIQNDSNWTLFFSHHLTAEMQSPKGAHFFFFFLFPHVCGINISCPAIVHGFDFLNGVVYSEVTF